MAVQDRMRNWYGEKSRALRRKNADENVRKRGRPKIRWVDRARGDIKENGVSGREVTHHLIIVDTDVVFHLPNSRLYHNQRNANITVSSATTFMCSSILVDGRFDQAVDVATMFTYRPYTVSSPLHLHCIYIYIYVSHFLC